MNTEKTITGRDPVTGGGIAITMRDGRIAAIYIVRNPDKLRHLAAAFDTSSG